MRAKKIKALKKELNTLKEKKCLKDLNLDLISLFIHIPTFTRIECLQHKHKEREKNETPRYNRKQFLYSEDNINYSNKHINTKKLSNKATNYYET